MRARKPIWRRRWTNGASLPNSACLARLAHCQILAPTVSLLLERLSAVFVASGKTPWERHLGYHWYGYSCFRISERGQTTVVTDPHHPRREMAKLGLTADLVTISHDRMSEQVEAIRGENTSSMAPANTKWASSLSPAFRCIRKTDEAARCAAISPIIWNIPTASMSCTWASCIRKLDQSIIEQLDEVHVLLLPVGGAALSGDNLADLIGMIEPSYVLPMQPLDVSEAAFNTALDALLPAWAWPRRITRFSCA